MKYCSHNLCSLMQYWNNAWSIYHYEQCVTVRNVTLPVYSDLIKKAALQWGIYVGEFPVLFILGCFSSDKSDRTTPFWSGSLYHKGEYCNCVTFWHLSNSGYILFVRFISSDWCPIGMYNIRKYYMRLLNETVFCILKNIYFIPQEDIHTLQW